MPRGEAAGAGLGLSGKQERPRGGELQATGNLEEQGVLPRAGSAPDTCGPCVSEASPG